MEPYRDAGVLAWLLEVAGWFDPPPEPRASREARSSEDEFEVHTRWFGTPARGVRLEERNGVDARSGYVNQERTRGALYGFDGVDLTLETVDGVFEGSFAELRVDGDEPFCARALESFTARFSRPA